MRGVEPPSQAWEAWVMPLYNIRNVKKPLKPSDTLTKTLLNVNKHKKTEILRATNALSPYVFHKRVRYKPAQN